jgi:glycosyltransferase involved in cell wall biosynthesis
MNLIGFSEGATEGRPGIVTVPTIHSSTAACGNHSILVVGGALPRGREIFQVADLDAARARREGRGTFGAISIEARGRWGFAPSILWRFRKAVRDADFVSLHSLYSFPVLAGYLLSRLYGKPFGVWPHGVLAPFQRQVSTRKKRIYGRLFADGILRKASVLFFSAEGERAETLNMDLHTPSVIIPDGFNAEEFSDLPPRGRFRERFFGGHDGPLILFLARLNAKKGIDVLITAMRGVVSRYPDARLALVGPPDPRSFGKQVSQWVKESGIDSSVVVTGPADPALRLEAFADADIYVLPSHAENFGLSVFEAMACGVPVIVSDQINYAREIAESGAGLAVPRTPDDIAAAIIRLLEDPKTRGSMGERGKVYSRKYSLEETGEKIAGTIRAILDHSPFPEDVSPVKRGKPAPTVLASE